MGNLPIGLAKTVKPSKDGGSFWLTIGALWPTKNARVNKLVLSALPIDGVLFLTEYEAKTDDGQTVPEGIDEAEE